MQKTKQLLNLIYDVKLSESRILFDEILKEKISEKLIDKKKSTAKNFAINVGDENSSWELNSSGSKQETGGVQETNGKYPVLSLKKHILMNEPHLARHKILSNASKREKTLDSLSKKK